MILAVDDCCPEGSAAYIRENILDPRVTILQNPNNLGVGGAVITGFQKALSLGADIVVKLDGDDQMDPTLITKFIQPIATGEADYTKGNRFYWFDGLQGMPWLRLFGNSGLSFINKLSSGYWDIMDPTNGYIAISSEMLAHLPLSKIENRYFFESDMLFRLGVLKAKVCDIPMKALYQDEKSNLSVIHSAVTFPSKYLVRTFKRILYLYFLRDFNAGSVFLAFSLPCLFIGLIYGSYKWYEATVTLLPTPVGTLFIIALLLMFGIQFLLSFIIFDVQSSPSRNLKILRGRE